MDVRTDPRNSIPALVTLSHVRAKGVELWAEQGRLRFKAPKGALSPEELQELRSSRDEIARLLEMSQKEPSIRSAPLAYSQLAHWHLYCLDERPAIRQIASATRLFGPLILEDLRKSLAVVFRRHDALRTRIVRVDGTLLQQISNEDDGSLELHNLYGCDDLGQHSALTDLIERQIMQPIDPQKGPLCGVSLVRLNKDEHVLIVTMEHMISDASSMGVFLQELFTIYADEVRNRRPDLPEPGMQFSEYAVHQHIDLPKWREQHDGYWAERLSGCERLRFPGQNSHSGGRGWGVIPVHIGRARKDELVQWCRSHRTTLVMAVFTAYVATVLRWCDANRAIFQFQTDGRVDHRIERSIGYFAFVLYLRLEISQSTTLIELLNQVTREYCSAYEHADQSYMEAQEPRPQFARNSCFNWVQKAAEGPTGESALEAVGLEYTPVPFEHPMLRTLERDNEPVLLLFEKEHEIVGGMHFSRQQFDSPIMDLLTGNLDSFLRALVDAPQTPVKDLRLRH